MTSSKIEWTEYTWNPIVGCSVVSAGCTNCYAMRMARRLSHNPLTPQYKGTVKVVKVVNGHPVWTGVVNLVEHRLTEPLKLKQPRRIFVNSMGDLFHENIPDTWIDRVFVVMERASWHTFQILTKRSDRMREYLSKRYGRKLAPAHMWFGVSVEDAARKFRMSDLREAPAAVPFLSVEPLIAPVGRLDLRGIHWVIVGGESGPGARYMEPTWAASVRDQCADAGVAFLMKQMTSKRPIPTELMVRQYPKK